LLEDVLVKYPQLKVQIMHANPLVYPMVLDMMAQFPKVYVELSPFQRFMPREKFHRMLMMFKEANVLSRVMFGTDGDDHGDAIEAYRSAEFLTPRELEGILCKNAARFLGRREVCEAD
jgi:predicted TIM-barrel fold metal-dependent hydrolase